LTVGKGSGLTKEATAKTYRYLDAEEIANQRKAKAQAQPTKGAGK
jgi:Tfp pilus assembly protein PilO